MFSSGAVFAQALTSAQQAQLAALKARCQQLQTQLAALNKATPTSETDELIDATEQQLIHTCKPNIPPPQPGPPNLAVVYGMEITQAVQDLDNDVALIAGKQTWARVYVSPLLPTTPQTVNVALDVTVNGATTHLTAKAPVTVSADANWTPRKTWNGGSINIRIPDELTKAGAVTFTVVGVTDEHGKSGVYGCYTGCGNPVALTFLDQPPVIVRAFGMKYNTAASGQPVVYAAPTATDFAELKSWVGRAYPTASVVYSTRVIHLKNGSALATTAEVNAGTVVNCSTADAQLTAIRGQDVDAGTDPHTHYIGLVSQQGAYMTGCATAIPTKPNPKVTASAPSGTPTSPGVIPINDTGDTNASFAGWYGGHELGHTFGRFHPGFCNGNSANDPHFPNPHGWISNGKGSAYAGLDVGDSKLGDVFQVIWVKDFDIMTYCNQPQWLSAYAYEGVRKRLLAEHPGFKTEAEERILLKEGPQIDVIALVDLTTATGRITSVAPVTRADPIAEPSPRAQIIIRDVKGSVLSTTQAPLDQASDTPEGKDQFALIDAAVDLPAGAAQVDVLLDGKVLDSYRPAAAQPAEVRNLRLEPNPAASDERLLLWDKVQAEPNSGRPTSYIVQTSKDGQTWDTVDVGATDLKAAISDLDAKHVRVIATNGFVRSAPVTIDVK